jgi:hypothetical protein
LAKDLQAGSTPASRELARYALTEIDFNVTKALERYGGGCLTSTIEEMRRSLRPLKEIEPTLNGSQSGAIANNLRLIGMKVMPTMSTAQCETWLRAILAALSDLPPHIAAKAAGEAIHKPFGYIADAEKHIRELAEQFLETHRRAIQRLRRMLDEITRANNPQPLIEDRAAAPLTDEEVHQIQRGPMAKEFIRIGLKIGSIQPSQLLPMEEDDHG